MKKEKAIYILNAIQNDFENALDDGEFENSDDDSKDADKSNHECVEALEMEIKALKQTDGYK